MADHGALSPAVQGPLQHGLHESQGLARGPGQPRVVAVVTGGGGSLISWLLREPGASSCLLEARVPYDKLSLLALLAEHGRSTSASFCSPEMAAALAEASEVFSELWLGLDS